MKYTYLITALILFQFVNCSAQTLRPSNWYEEELKWQRNWINTFFSEYYHYHRSDVFKGCYDNFRSIDGDISRKIQPMSSFRLAEKLSKLDSFLSSNLIEFDSVLMVEFYTFHYENDNGALPRTGFYVHHKNELRKFFIESDKFFMDLTIEEETDDINVRYENLKKLKHGCGYGHVSLTMFSKGFLTHEVRRVFINFEEY